MPKKNSRGADVLPVISYLMLRKAIGIIGIALPVVLVLGKLLIDQICPACGEYRGSIPRFGIQSSISSYYWTAVGDLLVGGLCAIGIFLLSYKGQHRDDDLAGDLACVLAIGVALFPTSPENIRVPTLIGSIHYIFAAGLFITLAYFCLVVFQRKDIDGGDDLKPLRNRVYYTCGLVIIGCIVAIAVVNLIAYVGIEIPEILAPVFWFEAIAIWAFGWSWLVKGKGLGILREDQNKK